MDRREQERKSEFKTIVESAFFKNQESRLQISGGKGVVTTRILISVLSRLRKEGYGGATEGRGTECGLPMADERMADVGCRMRTVSR